MAEEETKLFTPGTMQTVIASTFVLALLGLSLSIYGYTRTTIAMDMAVAARASHVPAAPAVDKESFDALATKVSDLEAKTKALEEAAAAASAEEPGDAPK